MPLLLPLLPSPLVPVAMDPLRLAAAATTRRCYEVRCDPRVVTDAYGATFDRTGACMVGQKSVVVRTVDSVCQGWCKVWALLLVTAAYATLVSLPLQCPCNYPQNAYSNRRW